MSGIKVTRESWTRAVADTSSVDPAVSGEDYDWDPTTGGVSSLDQWKQPVRAATTANVTITTALNAGDAIDGVTLAAGDRVLVKDQAAQEENGIYVAGSSPARAEDMDDDDEVLGAVVYVEGGSSNAGSIWAVTTTTPVVVGTDAIAWASPGGSSGGITIKDEGTPLATAATSLDFVGAGVVASGTGGAKTITVSEPAEAAHEADTTDAHDASAISVADSGGHFAATDVEGALAELYADMTSGGAFPAGSAAGDRLRYNGSAWVVSRLAWAPVLVNLETLVTTDGLAVYVPLTTTLGDPILAEVPT